MIQKNGSIIWKTGQRKRKKKPKDEASLRDFRDNTRHSNISIVGFLEGDKKRDKKILSE